MDNLHDSEDNCEADIEYDIEQDNCIKDPEIPEQLHLSATPNVPEVILLTRKLEKEGKMALVMFNAIKTRRNERIKKRELFMLIDRVCHLEIYCHRLVRSCM